MTVKRKSKSPRADKRKGVKRAKHNIPDQIDIDIKHQEYLKFSKTLDENGRPKPLTEKQLIAMIRSAVRKKWMSCNAKLAFLEATRTPDMDEGSRSLWKWQCEHCGGWFKSDEINVDHRQQEKSFTELAHALPWASSILNAGGYEDLQILCIPDHATKTHMQSEGLPSWEHAVADKKAIALQKDKKDVDFLKEKGIVVGKNAKERREQLVKYFLEEG